MHRKYFKLPDPCRFEGKAAQALAFAILKHESLWSATDEAIVQQWPRGRHGRRRIIADIEDILASPETFSFLDGLDEEPLHAERLTSGGILTTLARLLCCSLPARRIRSALLFHASASNHLKEDAQTGLSVRKRSVRNRKS